MPKEILRSTREAYGDALVELGSENDSIVALCTDLTESTKTDKFATAYPARFFQVGVAEQNMAGIAAGLARSGKIPFMAGYSMFSPGRNWEQIRLAICYSKNNVKLVGTHSGLSASADGATHQALEDIALTRVLPNMTVINPIDYNQAFAATKAAAEHKGPVYLRLLREKSHEITKTTDTFEIGRAYPLQDGKDITIFATGPITAEVVLAVHELKTKHKLECSLVAVPTIKPLDQTTILKFAGKTNLVVTVEEHQVAGGLGSAISEVLSAQQPTRVLFIGMQDSFGDSGNYNDLKAKFGLSAEKIGEQILEFYKKWH